MRQSYVLEVVLQGQNWHEGVIGIVASRIKDKFNKPTVIISINGKIGKASALLAASVFHFGTFSVTEVKEHMKNNGIPVRLWQIYLF